MGLSSITGGEGGISASSSATARGDAASENVSTTSNVFESRGVNFGKQNDGSAITPLTIGLIVGGALLALIVWRKS